MNNEFNINNIVVIKPEYVEYHESNNDNFLQTNIVDWSKQCIVFTSYLRWCNQSLEFIPMVTLEAKLISGGTTYINVPELHVKLVESAKLKRKKFIDLLKRLTDEERYLLLSEGNFYY